MGDVLSQSEVESLLSALEPGAGRGGSGPAGPAPSASKTARYDDGLSQISVYDFKRPERVSKDQMRAFQALHEGFSREFGAALSGMLRTIVEVKLISVDQLTYSEFVFSMENPTCFNLLSAAPLEGHMILDLNPSIIFPIVDRLLGGGKDGSAASYPRRPLTEIELRLVSRITDRAIECLTAAWVNVVKLQPKVVQVESNPQLVQIVPPNEVIVLISFEIMMGEMRGIMNLCIPYNTIEPLAGKLSSNTWTAYSTKQADRRELLNLQAGAAAAKVAIVVEMARTSFTAGELLNLEVGDVILTEKDHRSSIKVFIEGKEKFDGYPGMMKGHKAIRISRLIPRTQDLIEAEMQSGNTSDGHASQRGAA